MWLGSYERGSNLPVDVGFVTGQVKNLEYSGGCLSRGEPVAHKQPKKGCVDTLRGSYCDLWGVWFQVRRFSFEERMDVLYP